MAQSPFLQICLREKGPLIIFIPLGQSKGTENALVHVTAAKMGILKVTGSVFSVSQTD